jgi:hypothetical protein
MACSVLFGLLFGVVFDINIASAWDCSIRQPAPDISLIKEFDVVFVGRALNFKVQRLRMHQGVELFGSGMYKYERIKFVVEKPIKKCSKGDIVIIYRPVVDVIVNELSPKICLRCSYRVFAKEHGDLFISRTASPCWMMIQHEKSSEIKRSMDGSFRATSPETNEYRGGRVTKGRLKNRRCCSTCNASDSHGNIVVFLIIIACIGNCLLGQR